MKKSALPIALLLTASVTMTACSFGGSPLEGAASPTPVSQTPTPTPEDPINREGKVRDDLGAPSAEGEITALTDTSISLNIQGKDWAFALAEEAQKDISVFNKEEERVKVGTVVRIFYVEQDGVKTANDLEIIVSN